MNDSWYGVEPFVLHARRKARALMSNTEGIMVSLLLDWEVEGTSFGDGHEILVVGSRDFPGREYKDLVGSPTVFPGTGGKSETS